MAVEAAVLVVAEVVVVEVVVLVVVEVAVVEVVVDYFYHEEIRGTENTGKRNR